MLGTLRNSFLFPVGLSCDKLMGWLVYDNRIVIDLTKSSHCVFLNLVNEKSLVTIIDCYSMPNKYL